jgi:uncharacterized Zn finger protein
LVVVALACIRAPETIDRRPSLNQLLEQLNYVQTQALIQNFVDDEPDLLKKVDRFVHLMTNPVVYQPIETTPIPQRPITIDPQPFRQQTKYMMRNAMQCYEDGWEEDPIEMELPDIIQPIQNLIDRGDGDSAIAALDAITQALVEDWDDVEEYGANSDIVLQILDPLWAAAVLSTDLSSAEAIDIQINLEHWQDRLHSEFEISAEALRQGWNDPHLVAVLQGHSEDLWEDDRPAYADRLAQIRLQILQLQERYPEYLNLARAEEQIQEYAIMLTQLGQISEAMAASHRLRDASSALAVAKVFKEQQLLSEALSIAQAGLQLPSPELKYRYQLADWTATLAQELGDAPSTLTARTEAFKVHPSLPDYQQLQTLAGENWPTLQPELLQHLRKMENWYYADAKVQIFLQENLIDDAIATADFAHARDYLIQLVMDAAIPQRSDWVIAKARRLAEEIMDRGKSAAYQSAVTWLSKMRSAYLQSGRQVDWQKYLNQLLATHSRKRKLMELINNAHLS